MFESHSAFSSAPPDEAQVWRYMDLAGLLSLLRTSALHFTQAALMRDRWEASLGARLDADDEAWDAMRQAMVGASRNLYLNCWYVAEYESAAMWDLYQRDGRGVAVQSTWRRLKESLTTPWAVHGGSVQYIDYDSQAIDPSNVFNPIRFKRLSFSHEREARLVIWNMSADGPEEFDRGPHGEFRGRASEFNPPGYEVAADLDVLVEQIYVAPGTPDWHQANIASLLNRFGLDRGIMISRLDDDPIS